MISRKSRNREGTRKNTKRENSKRREEQRARFAKGIRKREKSGGKKGEKIGCECKRRCFRKGEGEGGDHPSVSVSGGLVVGVLVVVYVSLVGARAT